VNTDRSSRGLRRSIDDSADELGESVASDLPASTDDIHRQLPEEPPTEPEGSSGDSDERPLRTAIAESPIGGLLE